VGKKHFFKKGSINNQPFSSNYQYLKQNTGITSEV